jgi:Ca2+-binding EF-hand superfamily protein
MTFAPESASKAVDPTATQELGSLFALFDLNGDGEITPAELEQVLDALGGILAPEEITELRGLVQAQGTVSRDAFLGWARQQPGLETHQILRDLFQLIDSDGNG